MGEGNFPMISAKMSKKHWCGKLLFLLLERQAIKRNP